MSNVIYCTYCNKFWKGIAEYEEHTLNTCRNRDMSKPKVAKKSLEDVVKDLTKRLDKAEKEIAKLRSIVNTRNRKVIHEWLNQACQKPETAFDNWRKDIQVQSKDVERMMTGSISGGLLDGVMFCVETHLNKSAAASRPIRCFVQKPKTFYVYSPGEDGQLSWRIMRNENDTLGQLMDTVERKLRRKYNAERREAEEDNDDEQDLDQHQRIMEQINGTRVSQEKRLGMFKKWLFVQLEENLTSLIGCEYE